MLIAGGTVVIDGAPVRADIQLDGALIEEVVARPDDGGGLPPEAAPPALVDDGDELACEPPIFDDDVLSAAGCAVEPGAVEPLSPAEAARWPAGEWEGCLAAAARDAAQRGVTTLLVPDPAEADGPLAALAAAALGRVPALDEAAYGCCAPAVVVAEGAPADLRVVDAAGSLSHVVLRGVLLF